LCRSLAIIRMTLYYLGTPLMFCIGRCLGGGERLQSSPKSSIPPYFGELHFRLPDISSLAPDRRHSAIALDTDLVALHDSIVDWESTPRISPSPRRGNGTSSTLRGRSWRGSLGSSTGHAAILSSLRDVWRSSIPQCTITKWRAHLKVVQGVDHWYLEPVLFVDIPHIRERNSKLHSSTNERGDGENKD